MTPKRYRFVYVGKPSAHAFFEADLGGGEHYEARDEPPGSVTVYAVRADGMSRFVGTLPNTTLEQVEGEEITD